MIQNFKNFILKIIRKFYHIAQSYYITLFQNNWVSKLHYSFDNLKSNYIAGEKINLSGCIFFENQTIRLVYVIFEETMTGRRIEKRCNYPLFRNDNLEKFPKYKKSLMSGFNIDNVALHSGIYNIRLKYELYNGKYYETAEAAKLPFTNGEDKQPYQKVSIVSVLHNKANEVSYFLETIFQQSYPGDIEIIFVDDLSEDNSVDTVINKFKQLKNSIEKKHQIELKIIKNPANIGNCASRNKGVKEATGNVIVIIDADCLLNRDFLYQHTQAYDKGDCDVVIGSVLETWGQSPQAVLEEYETNINKVIADSIHQDSIHLTSFVNCVTRNFSISKKFLNKLNQPLFDEQFSYSCAVDSGFGWEDVEMGYRLYQQGVRIKYVKECLSIHISHLSAIPKNQKPLKSLKNFARLFRKHPELKFVATRWALDSFEKIEHWVDIYELGINEDRLYLQNFLKKQRSSSFFIRSNSKKRILTYRWHCPHQYELYKSGHEFHLVQDAGTYFTQVWSYDQRPIPPNAKFINLSDINIKNYDLVLLHFDENIISYKNTNNVITSDWGKSFKFMLECFSELPKIAICHGTPQFYGQYQQAYTSSKLLEVIEEERLKLVNYLGNMQVICNSYQAEREWGFRNSKVIWQGFDPTEFPSTTYKKGVLTLGKSMQEGPHYRGYALYQDVMKEFDKRFMSSSLNVGEPSPLYSKNSNYYAHAKYQNYIDNIRGYSIYFNPTIRSPMPRSRGEAMMCGLVTVSANNHDVEMFIKNGINGFYSNNPAELRDYLLYLLKNPEQAQKIGKQGRLTAMDIFNHSKYLSSWEKIIQQMAG